MEDQVRDGILALFTGYRIAKKSYNNNNENLRPKQLKPDTGCDDFVPGINFHLLLLPVHLFILPVLLFLLNLVGLHPASVLLCIAYIICGLFLLSPVSLP